MTSRSGLSTPPDLDLWHAVDAQKEWRDAEMQKTWDQKAKELISAPPAPVPWDIVDIDESQPVLLEPLTIKPELDLSSFSDPIGFTLDDVPDHDGANANANPPHHPLSLLEPASEFSDLHEQQEFQPDDKLPAVRVEEDDDVVTLASGANTQSSSLTDLDVPGISVTSQDIADGAQPEPSGAEPIASSSSASAPIPIPTSASTSSSAHPSASPSDSSERPASQPKDKKPNLLAGVLKKDGAPAPHHGHSHQRVHSEPHNLNLPATLAAAFGYLSKSSTVAAAMVRTASQNSLVQMGVNATAPSAPSQSTALVVSNKPLPDPVVDQLDDETDDLSSTITLYQGFRAVYPKMATAQGQQSVRGRPAPAGSRLMLENGPASDSPAAGGELQVSKRKSVNLTRENSILSRLPNKARNHAAAITNIARIFTELLNERDQVLQESERLTAQTSVITEELRQIEDLMTELVRRKGELEERLQHVSEREEVVESLLGELDERISSIGEETSQFERKLRSIKGDHAPAAARHQIAAPSPTPSNTCLKTLYGHTDSIITLDFDTPQGTLATGSSDKTIRIWDLSSHRCSALLDGHLGIVRTLQISDGVLLSGSTDHTIKHWDLTRLDPLPLSPGKSDSGAIAAASEPHSRPLHDEVCARTFQGHTAGVTCLKFDSTWLLSGSLDKTLRQWDMTTGQEITVLRTEKWVASEAPVSPVLRDNPFLDDDDLLDRQPNGTRIQDVGGSVHSLEFIQHALVSGFADGIVRLWDLRTGQCHRELNGHVGGVNHVRFDSSFVISAGADRFVKIWDLRTGQIVEQFRLQHSVSEFSCDSKRIAIAGAKEVTIYNRATLQYYALDGHSKPTNCVKLFDETLVTGGMDHTTKLWKL